MRLYVRLLIGVLRRSMGAHRDLLMENLVLRQRFYQISDDEALRARDLVVARPPPDSASAASPPQMAPDFRSLSEI